MNMAESTSSWHSAAGAAEECQYLNQLKEDLKTTSFNGTKCKNSFVTPPFLSLLIIGSNIDILRLLLPLTANY